jgi:hypothetical protein
MLAVLLITGMLSTGCENFENPFSNDDDDGVAIRYFSFKYKEVPANMSDATLMQRMRSGDPTLRSGAKTFYADMLTPNPFAPRTGNKMVIYPSGGSNPGGMQMSMITSPPIQSTSDSVGSAFIYIGSEPNAGHTYTNGYGEARFGYSDTLDYTSENSVGAFEMTVDNISSNREYATGSFNYIVRHKHGYDNRKYVIMDGTFLVDIVE